MGYLVYQQTAIHVMVYTKKENTFIFARLTCRISLAKRCSVSAL
jgi:hypothetical protein